MLLAILGASAFALALLLFLIASAMFRTVVSTNDVHIVQSSASTVSYGKDQKAGNTYWKFPPWIPFVGVKTISLPVSVFDVDLNNYAAYDKGRVPFVIDIMAFFRIEDSNLAAQRVHSFDELKDQLKGILQGACRSILAASEIEEILEGRATFGKMFTDAVDDQLKAWGVKDVKTIELMDIRDASGSSVIANIMEKKKSLIERESRIAVAENKRASEIAEVEATRQVHLAKQEAEEQVGRRTAEKDKAVGIAKELSTQEVQKQAALTAQTTMQVHQVKEVRTAEILKEVQIVNAEQAKRTLVINAEGEAAARIAQAEGIKRQAVIDAEGRAAAAVAEAEGLKQQTVLTAEGDLVKANLHAQGVKAEGEAKGSAEQAVLMAPVNSQITLAKEIGTNEGYQKYLLGVRTIEMNEAVGVAQATALQEADIKVIANTGDAVSGVSDVMQLFTSKGGTQLAAMAEALSQTSAGKAIVDKVTGASKANGAGH